MISKKLVSIILVFCLIITCLPGCSKRMKPEGQTADKQVSPTPTVELTPTPSGFICPLTGQSVESEDLLKLRPFAVMIDNEINARPQSGLNGADIVFEMPVEGNITRYMAVYHHMPVDKIGPVRSARPYFIDKALELNATYIHCGGSPQALLDIAALKVNVLNDLRGDPCFWRARDRKMPHNLYTSTKLIRDVMAIKKWENKKAPDYFKFSDDFLIMEGKKTTVIQFNYDKNYRVSYEYDRNEKVYFRSINGVRLIDKDLGDAIKTTNIIVEIVNVKVLDKAGRLEINNIGTNRGYYLSGGELIEIQWSKKARASKTIYKDLKGNELILNKGVTWVQVVPDYARIDIKE